MDKSVKKTPNTEVKNKSENNSTKNYIKDAEISFKKLSVDAEALLKNLGGFKKKFTDSKKTIMAHPYAGVRKPDAKLPKNILSIGGIINETTLI